MSGTTYRHGIFTARHHLAELSIDQALPDVRRLEIRLSLVNGKAYTVPRHR